MKLHDQPLIYMVMGDRFDHFLTHKAQEAGATVLDGHKVSQVEVTSKEVSVRASGETLTACVLVGADGVNSMIAKMMGVNAGVTPFGVVLQAEVYVSRDKVANWDSIVQIDWLCRNRYDKRALSTNQSLHQFPYRIMYPRSGFISVNYKPSLRI